MRLRRPAGVRDALIRGACGCLVAVLAVLACTASPDPARAAAAAPLPRPARTVTLLWDPTLVFTRPGGPVLERLPALTADSFSAARLLVLGRRDVHHRLWLRVALPARRPLDSGWVRAADVTQQADPYLITVSTASRKLRLYKAGHLLLDALVVVGKPSTPTPHGRFAIYDHVRVGALDTGPWEMPLTAYSAVLHSFDGGDGEVALHGMQGDLAATPGTAASHGCVRLPTWLDLRLAILPLGTPVLITG